jgi:hypothetical protein
MMSRPVLQRDKHLVRRLRHHLMTAIYEHGAAIARRALQGFGGLRQRH